MIFILSKCPVTHKKTINNKYDCFVLCFLIHIFMTSEHAPYCRKPTEVSYLWQKQKDNSLKIFGMIQCEIHPLGHTVCFLFYFIYLLGGGGVYVNVRSHKSS